MKLSLYQAALGATFLTYASASPLRVIVVSTSVRQEGVMPFRLGHAAANAVLPEPNVVRVSVTPIANPSDQRQRHGPCIGSKIRSKAIKISNMFRQALGLPTIESHHKHHKAIAAKPDAEHVIHGGLIRLIPVKMAAKPMVDNFKAQKVVGKKTHHGHHHRLHDKSFLARVGKSIMALGPWEGRAVAFVLGCGLGVLIRMFWVMVVLVFRTVKSKPEQDQGGYIAIGSAEDLAVPPPQYNDEKVESIEETEHS